MSNDFVFRGSVADVDPELHQLLERERIRQEKTIVLIPSESAAPDAVEEAMGSKFGNIYAEGYPREASRRQTEAQIVDFEKELALYRRNSDPRYYKGVEYADVLEALTRRRAAELFAANGVKPSSLYVNVQTLSGGPANSALYTAILKPGDTIMGLKLSDGGHLSHGAPVNRSGSLYKSVSYVVDPDSEQLDYDAIEAMALRVQPQVIVAGFSAYPLIIDWARFRAIADKVGAHFHADIAHISGLVAAGVHPSPIGIADTVMTTTHKSLCGPRGAMLMTHRKDLAPLIDRAVFPGEQGGGHFNTIGALAVALKLAQSDQFVELQHRIVKNAGRLAEKLQEQGLRVVGGGSENHLLLVDCRSVKNENGLTLEGDSAARVLDVAGIVTNRNTIPGDKSALIPSGVRLGTVWISQLGYDTAEIDKLAEAMSTILNGSTPYETSGKLRRRQRAAKVDRAALQHGRELVRQLTNQEKELLSGDTLSIRGRKAAGFMNTAFASSVLTLTDGDTQASALVIDDNAVAATIKKGSGQQYYVRFASAEDATEAKLFLQDLSDGYMMLDDKYMTLPGFVVVEESAESVPAVSAPEFVDSKPYYVGQSSRANEAAALPEFSYTAPTHDELMRTGLYEAHLAAGAKMVDFGGYDMPVWYTSVSDELAAVRQGSALFDVSHMGVLEASGPYAQAFLDAVTTNDVSALAVGRSHYTYLLAPDGRVIDDLMIYRMAAENYMMVINASNADEDWAWLNAVNDKQVQIDPVRPNVTIQESCVLRDLRAEGERVVLALQGPKSGEILASLGADAAKVNGLKWAQQTSLMMGQFDLIVSRSGYTGEREAFELLVSPTQVVALWDALLGAGATPTGLAARDSARVEAGLPLHGHELAGPHGIDPDTACYGKFVKITKPFFVGRAAYINTYETHAHTLVRFKMDDKGVRRPMQGDPIVDKRGKVVGQVTSCAIGSDGYLMGLALVPMSMRRRKTTLMIYQTQGGAKLPGAAKSAGIGARFVKPDTATVLTRF